MRALRSSVEKHARSYPLAATVRIVASDWFRFRLLLAYRLGIFPWYSKEEPIIWWSPDPRMVLFPDELKVSKSMKQVLKKGTFRHLALANPKTAPYGLAARTVLQKLKLWSQLKPRIVQGENISQTFQFIATRNAELGFVAVAQILDPKLRLTGSRWDIPEALYDPIRQDAVLLKRGRDNPAAHALIKFLHGTKARATIQRYGYGLSAEAP